MSVTSAHPLKHIAFHLNCLEQGGAEARKIRKRTDIDGIFAERIPNGGRIARVSKKRSNPYIIHSETVLLTPKSYKRMESPECRLAMADRRGDVFF
ncbi:MAG: hypothetical protein IJQ12_01270 [Lachnospiraceae bacterium]|nr:hypothetical protein [Lachnospiraceae bacterium]